MGVVHGGRQMVIPDMGLRVRAPRSAAAAPWWQVAGKTCVAAYQPKGAASLAASYVNLANPGVFDAAPGVAPTFDAVTGWTFDGSRWLLTCNVTQISTVIFRFIKSGDWYSAGGFGTNFVILPHNDYGQQRQYWNGGKSKTIILKAVSGVIALAGRQAYFNGIADGTELDAGRNFDEQFIIGMLGNLTLGFRGSVPVFAIYNTTLSAAQVAAVSSAMAAL